MSRVFSQVWPSTGTPALATFTSGFLAAIAALFIRLEILVEMMSIGRKSTNLAQFCINSKTFFRNLISVYFGVYVRPNIKVPAPFHEFGRITSTKFTYTNTRLANKGGPQSKSQQSNVVR